MACALEYKTRAAYVIGTNQLGELGLSKEVSTNSQEDLECLVIDKESRKTFIEQEALKGKPVEMIGIGKSGAFSLAIGKVVNLNLQEEEYHLE